MAAPPPIHESFLADCERIVAYAKKEMGINMTEAEAYIVWDHYSTSMCAGWLCILKDDCINEAIELFVKEKLENLIES